MEDTLDYLDEVYKKLKRLDTEVITKVIVDEDEIANRVAQKMKRGLSGRTSESLGI